MKRNILLILSALILIPASPVFAAEDFISEQFNSGSLEKLDEYFYEAPVHNLPIVQSYETKAKTVNTDSMPLFKRGRLNIQNYFRNKNSANKEPVNKEPLNQEAAEDLPAQSSDLPVYQDAAALELTGEIKEHAVSNDMLLDADTIEYHPERDEIDALGSPVLNFPNQNTTLKADKMVYNVSSNILKAYGNVELIKDGSSMYGDFMQINTNEETAFLDNFHAKKDYLTIQARDAESQDNKVILNKGKLTAHESYILKLKTIMIHGTDYDNMMIDDKSYISDTIANPTYNIKAKEIYVNAKKEHDVVTIKDATIYLKDKKLFRIPSFTAHTNKQSDYAEANYPEFGSRANLGMFAGPGVVFDIPNGAVLKVLPLIVNRSGLGVGGALKYRSANNTTDFAYGSAGNMIVMRGIQELDDKLRLQYGINSFTEDWFMGRNMSKYMTELIYEDSAVVKNSIAEGLNLTFKNRASIGYIKDGDVNRRFESIHSNDTGTMRMKYMAEIDQSLFSYKNIEKRQAVDFSMSLQGSAALYGTGDTQMIGRIGPRLHTQYKNWMQDIGYYLSAYEDNTPLVIFDTYRFGHSNVYLREALRVNKYLTLAWRGSFNLLNDAPNKKPMQECTFFVSVGPDDFKVTVGYDFMREQTYFTIAMALDLKGSTVEFEKMEIKNPDRLSSQSTGKMTIFEDNVPVMKTQMQYAEVIEIEDPDKEQL
ncbi:MAG: hypothetical protein LBK53_03670 [Heliobacteriaceae bacterium]|nr:hypothetical protein [Heliobacteriaceae bacterium]